VGFVVFIVPAGVADLGGGGDNDLPMVGGVGHGFLVAGHGGGEHGFPKGGAGGAEAGAGEDFPVGKHEACGGAVVCHGGTFRCV